MTEAFWHRNLLSERVHTPISFIYDDETEREAATGFITEDLYKFALQTDDNSVWVLIDDVTPTWEPVGNTDAMLKAVYDTDDDGIVNAADVAALAADIDIGSLSAETPTSGDLVVIERAGVRHSADVDDLPGGGGGIDWDQAVNEDGSTFANWTSGSGTWSSDGSKIKQTDTGATHRTARFTNALLLAPGFVFEAKIKAVSTGAGATHLIGLVIGYDGTNSTPACAGAFVELRNTSGTKTIRFGRYATSDILVITQAWNDDTYYTLRLISSGGLLTAYLDGVLIATAALSSMPADARYIGLASFACEAHFDDIKGYALTLP